MKITKRNGKVVLYDDEKVVKSIMKANSGLPGESLSRERAAYFAGEVFALLSQEKDVLTTRDVRACVSRVLEKEGFPETAKKYTEFRK